MKRRQMKKTLRRSRGGRRIRFRFVYDSRARTVEVRGNGRDIADLRHLLTMFATPVARETRKTRRGR